jgi:hypothetical protein
LTGTGSTKESGSASGEAPSTTGEPRRLSYYKEKLDDAKRELRVTRQVGADVA